MVAWSLLLGLYALGQLVVLGYLRATVSWRTLGCAVLVGLYACTALVYPIEFIAIRALELAGVPDPVTVASYSVDPLIEETIKAAPLALLALKAGRSLGMTDLVLLGASTGLGFRLAEEWLWLTKGIDPHLPFIGGLVAWLPGQETNVSIQWGDRAFPLHIAGALVWTALAGFGIGLARTMPGPKIARILVPLCVLAWVSFDHALVNFTVHHASGSTISAASYPAPAFTVFVLNGFGRAMPYYLLVALVAALWLDWLVPRGARHARGQLADLTQRLLPATIGKRPGTGRPNHSLLTLASFPLWLGFIFVFLLGTTPLVARPWQLKELVPAPVTTVLFLLAAVLAVRNLRSFYRTPAPATLDDDSRARHQLWGLLAHGVVGTLATGMWLGVTSGPGGLFHGAAHLYEAAGGASPLTLVTGAAPGAGTAGHGVDQKYP